MKNTVPGPLWVKTLCILFLLIVPLNVASLFAANRVIQQAAEISRKSSEMPLNTHLSLLDEQISNTNIILYTFPSSNEYCMQYLAQLPGWKHQMYRNKTYHDLLEYVGTTSYADQIFFYLNGIDDFLNISASYTEEISSDTIKQFIQDNPSDNRWHYCVLENQPVLIQYSNPGLYYSGAVIRLDSLAEKLSEDIPYQSLQVRLADSDGFPASDPSWLEAKSEKSNLHLQLQVDPKEVTRQISAWQKFLLGFFFLYLLLLPCLYFLFRRHISVPLNRLNQAHNELKSGNESWRIEESACSREFYSAFHSFNEMAETLQHLRLEKINQELASKQLQLFNLQLQLSNLQLQIRPHFLLNTMNLLYAMIQRHKEGPAQEMVLYLSSYFRHMFRFGQDLVLIDKELELVKEYLRISEYRYPDAFRVSWQIDPETRIVRIPALLLHNFIENILSHALSPERFIHIIIFTEYDEKTVTIQISDDGLGIEPEIVSRINGQDYETWPEGKHVGIRNSIRRLKYYYGDSAELFIESELGVGTTVTIHFPYDLDDAAEKP